MLHHRDIYGGLHSDFNGEVKTTSSRGNQDMFFTGETEDTLFTRKTGDTFFTGETGDTFFKSNYCTSFFGEKGLLSNKQGLHWKILD